VERGQSTEGKEVRSLNVREYKQEQEALRLAHEAQLSETKKNISESSQELQETLASLETALGEKIALENKIKALWKPLESSESVDELLTRTKKTITGKAVRKQDDDRALIEKARRASFFEQRLDKEKQTSSNLSRVVSKKDSEISELKKENKELKDLCSQLTEERDMQRDFIKTYGLTDRFSEFVAEKQAQARELARKAVKKISNRFSR
jgi:DNA repair ATPase RecN